MSHFAIRVLLTIVVLASGWTALGPVAVAADGVRLVIGRISQEPRKHYSRLQAMADYLALQLAGDGIAGVDVVMVGSPEKMEEMLEAGQVDIISETPFEALQFEHKGLVTLLLREWKGGVSQYKTLIIARKDGPLNRLEDLPGHRFAFEDPGSTSGYLVPRAAMESFGLSLVELANPRDSAPEGKVGYSFAKGEINIVAWVNRGLADAGALSDLDWNNEKDAPHHLKQDLKVIHETRPITRSILMVRATMNEALKQRIKRILMRMDQTRDGKETLKAYFKVAKYDELDGDALEGLEAARALWKQVYGSGE